MSTYEISKSSLLSLKAEILKKQNELQKVKAQNKIKLQEHRKPLELKKNKKVEAQKNENIDVNPDLLEKSRSALEAKSILYDQLSKGSKNEHEKEFNRRYLVQFDQKAHFCEKVEQNNKLNESEEENNTVNDDYSGDENDWVEFVDSFGRTRTCLKEDLPAFKQKDADIQTKQKERISRSRSKSPEVGDQKDDNVNDNESELLSGDMRRELLRQQWEREELLLKDKTDVHYQDILFSEARTHGVGYYGFAKDEETRIKQQEALKTLRKETEKQQKLASEVKLGREKQLKLRIRAAKNRKRAREGLPPVTSEDEEAEEEKKQKFSIDTEPVQTENKKIHDDAKDKSKEISRQLHVRPWDIGKESLDIDTARIRSGARDPYDQGEWNDIQRQKRNREFAPPQSYDVNSSTVKRINPYKYKPTPIQNECEASSSSNEEDELMMDYARSRQGANIPPPCTYDYYGPSGSGNRPKTKTNMEDAIMQGLKYLRDEVEKKKH